MRLRELSALLRCNQYIKNIFCLIPCFYGFELTNSYAVMNTAAIFIVFCVASSAVYILNDLFDYNSDRQHRINCSRPIASGRISHPTAAVFACVLCFLCLTISWLIRPAAMVCVSMYLLINIFYCLVGKKLFLVDLLCIVAGFELRTFAGCVAIWHDMTVFLFVEVFLLCSMLVLSKRLTEKAFDDGRRITLKYYTSDFCQKSILFLAFALNVVWLIYTFAGEPVSALTNIGRVLFFISTFYVIRASSRYVTLSFEARINYHFCSTLYRDKQILINVLSFILLNFAALYL